MKYNTLIVSGCSFTAPEYGWARALANYYNLNLINLAYRGSGNIHIANSIILYLEKNNLNPNKVLVGIMWSGLGRMDFISSSARSQWDTFNYDKDTKLIMSSDALKKYKLNDSMIENDPELELLELAYSPGSAARTTNSWLAMNHLISYLSYKKYNFFQTSFYDYTKDAPGFKNPFYGVNYIKQLSKVDLTLDTKNWVELDSLAYLGNYTYHHKLLDKDKWHPSESGATQWANECLIPALVNQGYV